MAQDGSEELRVGQARGPYDIDALATRPQELENSHLDLGSVLVPVVEGGQVTVEMSEAHQPQNVYMVTPIGRISMSLTTISFTQIERKKSPPESANSALPSATMGRR